MEPNEHRSVGVDLFNRTWELIETANRTPEQDDEMLGAAHASRYHWGLAEGAGPENIARGEWLLARVYTLLERAEPAMYHARRCLETCRANGIGDWDVAFALEAVARAAALGGFGEIARERRADAAEAGKAIKDAEDRAHFESDLASGPWFGAV